MALTAEQEAAVVGLLTTVGASGVSMDDLAETLKLGKLTTLISKLEAKEQSAITAKDAAIQGHDAIIAGIREQKEAARAALRVATASA